MVHKPLAMPDKDIQVYRLIIEEVELHGLKEFMTRVSDNAYKMYCYRGHTSGEYHLKHSLQRSLEKLSVRRDYWRPREKSIVRSFQSKAHLYLSHLPQHDSVLEWLSIMQHYGAPTRLLDFTYSPFVALFFAVETLSEEFAVYQVDLKRLKGLNNNLGVKYSFEFLQKLLDYDSKHPIVVPYEPLLQNERLVSQQGLFLASNSNTESLDKILNSYNANQAFIIKYRFQCHKTEVKRIIGELKKMNIDNFRLFPGIEGLSKAMRHSLLEPSSYIGTSYSK